MFKDELIKKIHSDYREDPWINYMFNAAGIELDNLANGLKDITNELFFDTMVLMVPVYEKLLQIKVNENTTIEERRSLISSKFKSGGQKCTVQLIKAIASSFGSSVDVDFINGKIKLTFDNKTGVPNNIELLLNTLDSLKPAHLALYYTISLLLVENVHTMPLDVLGNTTIEAFMFN